MYNIVCATFYLMLGIEGLLSIPFILKYRFLDRPSKLIFYYLISSIIFGVGSLVYIKIFVNNMCWFSIMHYIQFFILSLFYRSILKNTRIKTDILIIAGILFLLLLAVLDFCIIEGKDFYNSLFVTTRNIFIMMYSIIYLFQLLNDTELVEREIYITELPTFWFNAAIFIFLNGFFMFGLFANHLQVTQEKDIDKVLLVLCITYIIGILQCGFIYIGVRKIKYKKSIK